jgi:hypothetical protein
MSQLIITLKNIEDFIDMRFTRWETAVEPACGQRRQRRRRSVQRAMGSTFRRLPAGGAPTGPLAFNFSAGRNDFGHFPAPGHLPAALRHLAARLPRHVHHGRYIQKITHANLIRSTKKIY